ncbi:MAG: NAD(P)H-dependent oxidoreductase [Eubacterium sp.]|nr:NAD(P)H-dependent oxidoreductase [Eubacterium sp.]
MILFVNACVRKDSRTKRLADHLLARIGEQGEEPIEEVKLSEISFPTVDEAFLVKRGSLIAAEAFDDPMFAPARQFAGAEKIVIAAPYWDLSFPASLKQYIEQINVLGITFSYTPEGTPEGLCRAKELYYVMTAGGAFCPEDYGFGYIKALAENFYGIQRVSLIKAVGLDIIGADVEEILREAVAAYGTFTQ